jgi:hypothetical protein
LNFAAFQHARDDLLHAGMKICAGPLHASAVNHQPKPKVKGQDMMKNKYRNTAKSPCQLGRSVWLTLSALLLAPLAMAASHDSPLPEKLARNFAKPPAAARPWVYWFPLSGNLSKKGITADLEAMARVGIGGVLYMEVDQGAPKGPADFAGPLWRELFTHACNEAQRLGLEINMHNDAGWCGSGSPWITPELSMQKVVWSETVVAGGKKFTGELAKPHFRDCSPFSSPCRWRRYPPHRNSPP